MKATLAAKAALCVCPTLVMGAVAVKAPKARQAVHKMTASKAGKKPVSAKRRAAPRYASLSLPCPPAFVGTAPALAGTVLPLLGLDGGEIQLAGSLPSLSAASVSGVGSGPGAILIGGGGGGGGTGGGVGGGGGGVIEPTPPFVAGRVPEPEAWVFMIVGFGALGSALRWRRQRVRATRYALGGAKPMRAKMTLAAGIALPDAVGVAAVSTKMGLLAKAALCVCPPALLAGAVTTVPAVRQAVHSATAPAKAPAALRFAAPRPLEPCDPSIESASLRSGGGKPDPIPAVIVMRDVRLIDQSS